jgi:hypothetical protein
VLSTNLEALSCPEGKDSDEGGEGFCLQNDASIHLHGRSEHVSVGSPRRQANRRDTRCTASWRSPRRGGLRGGRGFRTAS